MLIFEGRNIRATVWVLVAIQNTAQISRLLLRRLGQARERLRCRDCTVAHGKDALILLSHQTQAIVDQDPSPHPLGNGEREGFNQRDGLDTSAPDTEPKVEGCAVLQPNDAGIHLTGGREGTSERMCVRSRDYRAFLVFFYIFKKKKDMSFQIGARCLCRCVYASIPRLPTSLPPSCFPCLP